MRTASHPPQVITVYSQSNYFSSFRFSLKQILNKAKNDLVINHGTNYFRTVRTHEEMVTELIATSLQYRFLPIQNSHNFDLNLI